MPPKGFNSVSIDDETADLLDAIIEQTDCTSRSSAIDLAAGEWLVENGDGGAA